MIAIEDGRYEEAIPLLKHVLEDSPLVTAAQTATGNCAVESSTLCGSHCLLAQGGGTNCRIPSRLNMNWDSRYTKPARAGFSSLFRICRERSVLNGPTHNILWLRVRSHPAMCLKLWSCCSAVVQLNPQHFRANLLLAAFLPCNIAPGGLRVPQQAEKIRAG